MGNVYGVSLLVHLLIHYLFVDRIFKKKKNRKMCNEKWMYKDDVKIKIQN